MGEVIGELRLHRFIWEAPLNERLCNLDTGERSALEYSRPTRSCHDARPALQI